MCLMFVFCWKKPFFLCVCNIFFRLIWNHSLRKTLEFDSNEWGWIVGEKTITPRWMAIAEASKSCRELIMCSVKWTAQDNASVKSINLDLQSYVDVLDIATIELVFNDFYSIVFFSKQWTKLNIFFKKSTNNVI